MIDEAIARGGSSRPIASQFGLGYKAVQRHQQCIARLLKKVDRAKADLAAEAAPIEAEAIRGALVERAKADVDLAGAVERAMFRAFETNHKIMDARDEDLADPDNPEH